LLAWTNEEKAADGYFDLTFGFDALGAATAAVRIYRNGTLVTEFDTPVGGIVIRTGGVSVDHGYTGVEGGFYTEVSYWGDTPIDVAGGTSTSGDVIRVFPYLGPGANANVSDLEYTLRDFGQMEFWSETVLRHPGDLNCDGLVNNSDIPACVLALSDPENYALAYPGCDRLAGDVNGDGEFNNADIPAFVELLVGG